MPGQAASPSWWVISAAAPHPPLSAPRTDELEGGWIPVRPRHWWRQCSAQQHSWRIPNSRSPFLPAFNTKEKRGDQIKLWKRECFRCFYEGHIAQFCRDPIRCRYCRKQGHIERYCRRRQRDREAARLKLSELPPPPPPPPIAASRPSTTPPPPPPPPFPLIQLPLIPAVGAMPRIGDPSLRPEEGHLVIDSDTGIQQAAEGLANHAAVIRLGGSRPRANASDIAKIIAKRAKLDIKLLRVVPYYLEDFFATFTYGHHRDLVANQGRFNDDGLNIHVHRWNKLAHADAAALNFHVHLCLEGVPFQAWNGDVVNKLIGKNAIMHYFDVATTQREDASAMSLWAWCASPSDLPKVMWLTILDGQVPSFDVSDTPVL
uniref:Uncharacterized protein n=1 Tax=Avena sativa TaxID=4498 RepID=A0ACD5ZVD3_AVESA